MNPFTYNLFIEIGQEMVKVLRGDQGWEISVERTAAGRLTDASRKELVAGLKQFLGPALMKPKALCAIPARGVSVRKLTLPPGAGADLDKLLPFQIEREFPLPPQELAWGCKKVQDGANPEVVVVAVRKDVLEEYNTLAAEAGFAPTFTLAALARSAFATDPRQAFTIVHLGGNQAEISSFENGCPTSIRNLAVENGTDYGASPILCALGATPATARIYLSGPSETVRGFKKSAEAAAVSRLFEVLEISPRPGCSTGTVGLQKSVQQNGSSPLITLESRAIVPQKRAGEGAWKLAGIAALLLLGCFALRYVEPLVQRQALTRRVAEFRGYRERFPAIDRELGFLQYLKTNQPAYLDPLYVVAQSAPHGMKIEAITLNRRGEFNLRAGMQNSQQATDFRSKLIESGVFSTVVLEEQAPTPDRQKITIRMVAQWKPGVEPKVDTNAPPAKPGTPANRPPSSTRPSVAAPKKGSE